MKLNEAVIDHYRAERMPISEIKRTIKLNEDYIKEKPTWYMIDGKAQYFKIRSDFRLFTEQFFSKFGKQIMGFNTVDYRVAYVRTIIPGESPLKEETKCGLLSENFQTPQYNYYLVSELMNPEISNCSFFGKYSLSTLLKFFKEYLTEEDYKENELFLIKLFISDAYTHQEDRNWHNIGFQIPKIKGVTYSKRLHPEQLVSEATASEYLEFNSVGAPILKGLEPSAVYDNERIFGTDHKFVHTYEMGQIWCPLFPYDESLLFQSQQEAQECADEFDGLDPNLLNLYMDHYDICKPIFERLAESDEYREILNEFTGGNSQIILSDDEYERIVSIVEDKKKTFQRILKY